MFSYKQRHPDPIRWSSRLQRVIFIVVSCYGALAGAHEIRPAVATVTFDQSGYSVELKLNVEAVLAGVSARHADTDDSPQADQYNRLRKSDPAELEVRIREFAPTLSAKLGIRFDDVADVPLLAEVGVPAVGDRRRSRITTLEFRGTAPADSSNFYWLYDPELGRTALRIRRGVDGEMTTILLGPGEESAAYPLAGGVAAQSWGQTAVRYLDFGYTHIVPKGLDHILFVLGLFLLSLRLKPLLWQVTAFTIAHSITLGLTIYGVVSLSPAIVEPLIALSIVYVAVENILTTRLRPWRVVVVFMFGLLHGMGFAGVLQEIGLPPSDFLTALVTFNLGVELGQLTVITVAFLAVGIWAGPRRWYRAAVVIPGSLIIGAIGLYWTVERIAGGILAT